MNSANKPSPKFAPVFWGVFATLVILVLTLVFWQAMVGREHDQLHSQLQEEVDDLLLDVSNAVEVRVNMVSRMEARWESMQGSSQQVWESDAAALLEQIDEFTAFAWIDPSGVVRWTQQAEVRELVPGQPLDPKWLDSDVLSQAESTGGTRFGPLVELETGNFGILIVFPLHYNERYDGSLAAVLDISQLWLQLTDPEDADTYLFQLSIGANQLFQPIPAELLNSSYSHSTTAEIGERTWLLSIQPTEAAFSEFRSPMPVFVLTSGISMALLLGLVVYFGIANLREKQHIKEEVRNQTARLAGSELRYRSLIEHLPIPLWEYDFSGVKQFLVELSSLHGPENLEKYLEDHPDAVVEAAQLAEVISVNQVGRDLHGVQNQDQIENTESLVDVDGFRRQMVAMLSGELPYRDKTFTYLASGKMIDINLQVNVPPGHEDDWKQMLAMVVDISNEQEVMRSLAESEDRFRTLSAVAPIGIFLSNSEGQSIYANQRLADINGLTIQESLGDGWTNQLHPDDAERVQASWRRSTQELVPFNEAYRFVKQDGSLTWVSVEVAPVLTENGETSGYVGVVSDITEQRTAWEQLQSMNQLSRFFNQSLRLSDNLPDVFDVIAVLIPHDQIGIALFTEDQEMQVFGSSSQEDEFLQQGAGVGLPVHPSAQRLIAEPEGIILDDLSVNGSTPAPVKAGYRSSASVGLRFHGEVIGMIVVASKTPSFFDERSLELLRSVADQMAPVIESAKLFQQIQENAKNLEARVAERTSQLGTALQELESFTYTVSHDLKAPLRALDGFSHILLAEYGASLEADAQRLLKQIQDNSRIMESLIMDLLQFSQLGKKELAISSASINTIINEALRMLKTEIDAHKAVIHVEGLPNCNADPGLLRQVFVNLISNAVKFSKPNAVPHIRIYCDVIDELKVCVVQDDGIGFEPQYSERIFGVFERLNLSEDYEGTGVGLAIIRRIIERHSGQVWAESAIGEGAKFMFSLPGMD